MARGTMERIYQKKGGKEEWDIKSVRIVVHTLTQASTVIAEKKKALRQAQSNQINQIKNNTNLNKEQGEINMINVDNKGVKITGCFDDMLSELYLVAKGIQTLIVENLDISKEEANEIITRVVNIDKDMSSMFSSEIIEKENEAEPEKKEGSNEN